MSARLNATTVAAALGAADTAAFLARRPQMFREARGRALGGAVGLVLWTGLAATSALDGKKAGIATLALSQAVLAGSLAILAVHLRRGVAGPRVFLGAALSIAAAGDTLRRR